MTFLRGGLDKMYKNNYIHIIGIMGKYQLRFSEMDCLELALSCSLVGIPKI